MSVSNFIEKLLQLGGIDEVAIVGKDDAVRTVDVERLCFGAGTCDKQASNVSFDTM